ncbi:hypothetical protein CRG98_035718 [Punica granatum]|uniref:Uncharacterized protein n=1 Tax=Punica granatum TaxID=22663 RepID=A0A2I0IIT1_PUNGR|nr:hypothetical protein CRG98_035718 [Punica granatum]
MSSDELLVAAIIRSLVLVIVHTNQIWRFAHYGVGRDDQLFRPNRGRGPPATLPPTKGCRRGLSPLATSVLASSRPIPSQTRILEIASSVSSRWNRRVKNFICSKLGTMTSDSFLLVSSSLSLEKEVLGWGTKSFHGRLGARERMSMVHERIYGDSF